MRSENFDNTLPSPYWDVSLRTHIYILYVIPSPGGLLRVVLRIARSGKYGRPRASALPVSELRRLSLAIGPGGPAS